MKENEFDYNKDTDDLPPRIIVWIVIIAMVLAVYLSQVLV